jgi:putative endonuclease
VGGVFWFGVMWFVYALKSMNHTFHYVGHTQDVQKRLDQHNSGLVQSTKHYAPFTLETYIAVKTERKAIELEKYLKAGSGKAVLMKRFLS